MLQISVPKYYVVKRGQTVKEIAFAFGVAVGLLIKENALKKEPYAGQRLIIPTERGDRYVAQAGDEKTLLCGSDEMYYKKNGTHILYPGMSVIL